MAITAYTGPLVTFGITQTSTGQVMEYNEQRGPSLNDLGQGTLDPRYQYNYEVGSGVTTQVWGLWDQQGIIDYVPFTAVTSAIATQQPTAGTPLTLTGLSSLGFINTTIIAPETGQSVSVIAIDSTAATLNYGQSGTIAIWNPGAGAGRAISVVNSSNTNTEQYIVRGRDMYGFKMTETILASTTSSGTSVGRKAFKYIQSIVPSTATTISATGVSIGMADIFGLPLKAPYMNGITVWVSSVPNSANNIVLSSANSVLASTPATQTSTMPDIRGTYASSIPSNGIGTNPTSGVRVTIYQPITAGMTAAVQPTNTQAMFGTTQFSDF